jgi:hypothetical protein
MYYTITNTIGTKVQTENGILVCGDCYPTKIKAPKDENVLYAFSKAENPVDDLVWRFDGTADIDYEGFKSSHINQDRIEYVYSNIIGEDFDPSDHPLLEIQDALEQMLDNLCILAWKSEKINIQSKIRPSKDSKKALLSAEKQAATAELDRLHAEGDIDDAEWGERAMALLRKYM